MSNLEEQVGARLLEKKQTIATAESCTGGLIAHRLTNIAGSSAYLLGGIVAYSNEAKMYFLNVQQTTLQTVGAVSQQAAAEMAQGARRTFGSHLALSVTGIAGPGGGTDEKPVGLVYIGLATPTDTIVQRFVWESDRVGNKEASAEAALKLVLEYLA